LNPPVTRKLYLQKNKGDSHLKRPMLGPFSTRQVERGNLQLNIFEQGRSITELAKALIDECDMSAVAINTNYEILYFSGPMNGISGILKVHLLKIFSIYCRRT